MIKKIIAREWLYFIVFMVIGFFVLPLFIKIIGDPQDSLTEFFGDFFHHLSRKQWGAWLIAIGPYILFQFIRSIVWAIRARRE